jgi:hypothetical protein
MMECIHSTLIVPIEYPQAGTHTPGIERPKSTGVYARIGLREAKHLTGLVQTGKVAIGLCYSLSYRRDTNFGVLGYSWSW